MKKRILSLFLMMAIMVSLGTLPAHATECDNVNSTPCRTNFVYLNDDIYNMAYTYTENGKDYKVIESANETLTEIHSEIYEFDSETGSFKSIQSIDTFVNFDYSNKTMVFTHLEEGKAPKTSVTHFGNAETMFAENSISTVSNNVGWVYARTYTTSTKFKVWTATIVTAAVGGAIGFKLGGTMGGAVGAEVAKAIVEIIIEEKIEIVYYSNDHYLYYTGVPDELPTREKVIAKAYRDKDLTDYIETATMTGDIFYHD